MNFSKFSIVILTIIMIFIIGCDSKKDDIGVNNELTLNESNSVSLRSDFSTPNISKLDIENIGKGHNDYLNDIISSLGAVNSRPSNSLLSNLFHQKGIPDIQFNDSSIKLQWENYFLDWSNFVINESPELSIAISNLQMIHITYNNYSDISNQFNILINNTESRSDITYEMRDILMTYYMVGKYSSEFWLPTSAGGTGVGYNFLKDVGDVEGNDDVARAMGWAEKDALGAAGGMIRWTGVAVLGGPVGVGGFIGGAIFGGAFASLTGG